MNNKYSDIIRSEELLIKAMIESDVERLDQMICDELQFVLPNGVVVTKQMDLENHRLKKIKIKNINVIERSVELSGTIASVATKAKLSGSFEGNEFEGTFLYLRNWIKVHEEWKIFSGSATALVYRE